MHEQKNFMQFPRLVCAFSNRHQQNMSLAYGDISQALPSRKCFLEPLGIDYRCLVAAEQTHGCGIACVRAADKGRGALIYDTAFKSTDAFITAEPFVPVSIFTADCLSVFIYDTKTHVLGLVHAGWKGTAAGIVAKAVLKMQREFNAEPKNMAVGLGPAIRKCCYQVGGEFNEFFTLGVYKAENSYYLDLIEINVSQLLESGIDRGRITDSGICTACQAEDFFSYRKEGTFCGRSMSVMMLR